MPNRLFSYALFFSCLAALPGFSSSYTLDPVNIERAIIEVVPQSQMDAGLPAWSCGPNSGARAIVLLGLPAPEVNDFARKSPQTISPLYINSGIMLPGLALGAGLVIQGQNQGLGLKIIGGSLIAGLLGSKAAVGPDPARLAQFLDQQEGVRAWHCRETTFDAALAVIRTQISQNLPVIVFVVFGQFAMHYMNAVAVDDNKQQIDLLDTSSETVRLSFKRMGELMNADSYWFVSGYNVIALNLEEER